MSQEQRNDEGIGTPAIDECPVCHGVLSEKDGSPWCPTCDLKFTA